jgi:hypothetical protein
VPLEHLRELRDVELAGGHGQDGGLGLVDPETQVAAVDLIVSPKPNASSRGSTFETAREDLGGGREKDAVNALFYAAEAAVVALAMASRREGSTTFKDFDRALEDILAEVERLVAEAEGPP